MSLPTVDLAPRRGPGFLQVVGQDRMKLALLLAAVDPLIGGVLIRGERGTAKSTLARALAAVLPPREVVVGCRFHCRPSAGDLCDECRKRSEGGRQLPLEIVPTGLVELPLGATEDRVVGSIDLEFALSSGEVKFQPGVLAEANGQVLYVDEVNLLDHHLVDVLLDAAASGRNVVEREGVSASHPSHFILIGTMNPEEGDLRPQLLDRFGLCVDVVGLRDPEQRVRVMESDLDLAGPASGDEELRFRLTEARRRLPAVELPRNLIRAAARMAVDQQVVGHRADLVMVRASRALAALRPGPSGAVRPAGLQDLMEVSELALVHRRRVAGSWVPTVAEGAGDQGADAPGPAGEPGPSEGGEGGEEGGGETGEGSQSSSPGPAGEAASGRAGPMPAPPAASVELEERYEAGRLQLPHERRRRRGSGRRSRTTSQDRRGRYVSSRWQEKTTDLALDATLRAAAPHQVERRSAAPAADGRAIQLERQDLRQKVRQRRIGNLILFLVDASASMDAEQRMDATRSAILALLREAYVRRDRVAMVSFAGRSARVVLRPTSSVDLAERQLSRLAVGGTTPLTHGLVAALDLIQAERRRDQEVLPLLVLISDGRGNISLRGDEPLREAQAAAAEIQRARIHTVVIDTSRDHSPPNQTAGSPQLAGYHFNACADLSRRLGGEYFALFDVTEQGILRPVAEALRRGA
ncbi:MAG: VWA domain-containing protein [Candidatus Dormibacteraeota bacterium]|nr:VWA domain-containing protein [Candidatus Dormibacteraeota bacterium]